MCDQKQSWQKGWRHHITARYPQEDTCFKWIIPLKWRVIKWLVHREVRDQTRKTGGHWGTDRDTTATGLYGETYNKKPAVSVYFMLHVC